jgi:16S rRNA (adenine1518-N6/adenine1519-N6)-dimethyltransferase
VKVRRRFGQHFLEAAWADKLVAVIAPQAGDVFLEIGPGRGALTGRLAAAGAPILGVEVDRELAAALAAEMPPNVRIVTADVLETDLADLAAGLGDLAAATGVTAERVRLVGNLPYNISSPILFRVLDLHRRHGVPADATVMLQREVADRLVAQPGTGEYGVLSILLQRHAAIERLLALPPGAFRPPPRVRSAVVRLRFRTPAVPVRDTALLVALVRALFTRRRKTLANALRPFAAALGVDGAAALREAGLEGRRRPETLQLAELAAVADALAAARDRAVL